jgi:hypothetical protein
MANSNKDALKGFEEFISFHYQKFGKKKSTYLDEKREKEFAYAQFLENELIRMEKLEQLFSTTAPLLTDNKILDNGIANLEERKKMILDKLINNLKSPQSIFHQNVGKIMQGLFPIEWDSTLK